MDRQVTVPVVVVARWLEGSVTGTLNRWDASLAVGHGIPGKVDEGLILLGDPKDALIDGSR